MKRILLIFLLLAPCLVWGQGVVVRTKPVSADTNAANYNKQVVSDANLLIPLTFSIPFGSSFTWHNATFRNGTLFWRTSDSTLLVGQADGTAVAIRGGGGGSGVTSITPGYGFTNHTPITSTGTLTIDTLTALVTHVALNDSLFRHAATAGKNITFRGDSVSTKDTIRVDNGTLFTSMSPGSLTTGNGLGSTGGISYQSQVYKNNSGVIQYDLVAGPINRIWGNALDIQARLQSHRTPTDSTDVVRLQDLGVVGQPNMIISGLTTDLTDSLLQIHEGIALINNTVYNYPTEADFILSPRDNDSSRFVVAYADNGPSLNIVVGALSGNPVIPDIPANSIRLATILITPNGYFTNPITGVNLGNSDLAQSDSTRTFTIGETGLFFKPNPTALGTSGTWLYASGNVGIGASAGQTDGGYRLHIYNSDASGFGFFTAGNFSIDDSANANIAVPPPDADSTNLVPTTAWVLRNTGGGGGAFVPLSFTTNVSVAGNGHAFDILTMGTSGASSEFTIDTTTFSFSHAAPDGSGYVNYALNTKMQLGYFSPLGNYQGFNWEVASASGINLEAQDDSLQTGIVNHADYSAGIRLRNNALAQWGMVKSRIDSAILIAVPSQTGNSGKFLTTNGSVTSWIAALSSTNFVDSETPSGTINSSNVTFTLANTPVSGSVHLYRNGARVTNFTVSTATITFASAPLTGDSLLADYRK